MKLYKSVDKLVYGDDVLEQDKFEMNECVICMEQFVNGK